MYHNNIFYNIFFTGRFFYWLRIFGARPDFLLVICGLLGFYVGNNSISFWCAVVAGVFSGSFSSCPALVFIIIYTISSFLGYYFRDKRYSSSPWFLLLFSCLLSFFLTSFYFILLFILGKLYYPLNMCLYFVAQCFLNALIIYPLAGLVRLFTRPENFDFRKS